MAVYLSKMAATKVGSRKRCSSFWSHSEPFAQINKIIKHYIFKFFLDGIFNAPKKKITVFKIKSHFPEYSSVISSLSIIWTEICMFSKFFKRMQVLQKQKKNCRFSAHILQSVKC